MTSTFINIARECNNCKGSRCDACGFVGFKVVNACVPAWFWGATQREDGSACWAWTRSVGAGGYGLLTLRVGGSWLPFRAHRVAYALAHAGSLGENFCVCHGCDNRLCCNPSHLFLGDREDNIRDMVSKGRNCKGERKAAIARRHVPRGEAVCNAKLTERAARSIITAHKAGVGQYQLAETYGVRQSTISRIVNGRRWPHLSRVIPELAVPA